MEPGPSVMLKSARWFLMLGDNVLRGRIESPDRDQGWKLVAGIIALMVCGGFIYGSVMGSYAKTLDSIRPWQVLFSGLKVPLLLSATFLLSLPSFYVANMMMGLHQDFGYAFRSLLATQAALTIVLAALSPFTFFWYVSGTAYDQALAFNAVMFGIASLAVQLLLRRLYRPLIEKNRLHVWMVRAWLLIYSFVGIQMGWVLRPFVGSPDSPTTFFREDAWGNAYLVVFELFRGLFTN